MSQELHENSSDDAYEFLIQYAFWLLGRKSYSEKEMHDKLVRRFKIVQRKIIPGKMRRPSKRAQRAAALPPVEQKALTERVMNRLRELKYLNDDALLENYFEYRLKNRPEGRYAFIQNMKRRGIPVEKAQSQWSAHHVDEHQLAAELLAAKQRQLEALPLQKKKQKAAHFLASRGFSPDVVWKALESLGRQ